MLLLGCVSERQFTLRAVNAAGEPIEGASVRRDAHDMISDFGETDRDGRLDVVATVGDELELECDGYLPIHVVLHRQFVELRKQKRLEPAADDEARDSIIPTKTAVVRQSLPITAGKPIVIAFDEGIGPKEAIERALLKGLGFLFRQALKSELERAASQPTTEPGGFSP